MSQPLCRYRVSVTADVGGNGDCQTPAGRLPQGDHVEVLLALIPAAVDGHHTEAVHCEVPELCHGGPGPWSSQLVLSPRLNLTLKLVTLVFFIMFY